MSIQRISLLGVPVDICTKKDLEEKILELLDKEGPKQIVFLSIWDLMRFRRKNEYADCIRQADLILPVSRSIIKGARFLKKSVPVRYNQFEAVIKILSTLESRRRSCYLFGGRKKALVTAEKNVRTTFRELQIVGRYVGYYQKAAEDSIVEAIHKSSPSFVILSDGIKEKECWMHARRDRLPSSIFLFYKDCIGIFGKRIKRVSPKIFDMGLEIWGEIFRNPIKIFLIFPFAWYIILLVWSRLFSKEQ